MVDEQYGVAARDDQARTSAATRTGTTQEGEIAAAADQESDQDHACDFDPAEGLGGGETGQRGLVLELLGG